MSGLINAPYDKEFVFQDGSRVKNILELVSKIESLNMHDFSHFVNSHKNDFANWIEYVIEDKVLSNSLRQVHSKDRTIELLKNRMIELYEKHHSNKSSHQPSIGGSIVHTHHHVSESNNHIHHELKSHTGEKSHHHASESHHKNSSELKSHHKDNHSKESNHSNVHHAETKNNSKESEKNNEKESKESKKILETPVANINNTSNVNDISNNLKKELKDTSYEIRDDSKKIIEEKNKEKIWKKWFKLFSKKSSPKDLSHVEIVQEDKKKVEEELQKDIVNSERENTMWALLYIGLISMILLLLAYRLFF